MDGSRPGQGSWTPSKPVACWPPCLRTTLRTALSLTEQLRREDHSPELVSALLTQSRLRTKARERWGDVVDQLVPTPDGAEQATRPEVAALRANRFAQAGVSSLVDLGCGIGLDALAFASRGLAVRAYEQDPTTAAAAELNARSLGLNKLVHVECHDVTSLDAARLLAGADGAFADPARRADGRPTVASRRVGAVAQLGARASNPNPRRRRWTRAPCRPR